MDYLDTRWTKLKDYDFGEQDNGETKRFIDSDEGSGDEEWVQQLHRDYGNTHKLGLRKRLSRWTSMEKYLSIGLIISIIIGVFLCVILMINYFTTSRYKQFWQETFESKWGKDLTSICTKKSCVERSYYLTEYIDEKTKPCDDFYQYSCGKWLSNVDIPSGQSKWTSFTKLAEKNHRKLKTILDKLHPLESESEAVKKAHMFYKACQNKAWMEKNGLKNLEKLIKDIGSWGLWNSTEWNDEDWSFEQSLTKIHKLKSMPLFYMFVATDDLNAKENSIQIQQSGITLSDETYYKKSDDNPVIKAYKNLMVETGLLLGGEKKKTEEAMEEVFQFEKKLATIYEAKDKLRKAEKIHHTMTVEQLQDLCPAIPWLDYMNSMFNTKVKFDETVVIYTPHYLKNMSDLVIRTERRILANYMVWHLIYPLLPMISGPFRAAYSGMLKAERGVQIVDTSWRSCVLQTDSVFGFATGYLFAKENENDFSATKSEVEGMITAIKEVFLSDILQKEWIDEGTKARAIEKVAAIENMVGYPEWIFDAALLTSYYRNLSVTTNPFKNYLNARSFYHQKTMNRRNTKPARNEWHVTPTSVNAFYNAPRNYIAFPLGVLQSPFFVSDLPLAVKFGALGTIIAHELTHGFDNQGRMFDKDGNMMNWWSEKSKKEYEKLASCFQEQYRNLTNSVSFAYNSKQTLAENIADNGGLHLAFMAYKLLRRNTKANVLLPGVPLSPDQLFFVSFAQVWCTASTASSAEEAAITDRHSQERIRVLATISNSQQFSSTFGCKSNSKMNPEKKCRVW
ncbi:endothelin-converting enzyme 2-like isoform X2 [Rhopilema esculentum]|uniref:endothelin-converting enzyme 2-like isoform X2 n=1 Tax=Rhopilema esculentum TaxID=499914 RepID=UPI0031DBD72B|eukprot:gene3620-14854_t